MKALTKTTFLITGLTLAACGGTTTDTTLRSPALAPVQAAAQTLSISQGYSDAFNEDPDLNGLVSVNSADVPLTGSYVFNGGMFARHPTAGRYVGGQLFMAVDLATDAVTGDIINVTEFTGTEQSGAGSILTGGTYSVARPYTGTLLLNNGQLSRQGELGTQIFGSFDGQLSAEGTLIDASVFLNRVNLTDVNGERTVFGFATGNFDPDAGDTVAFEAYIAAN